MQKKLSETVEVVYALPTQQKIVELPYSTSLTAIEAVEQSGLRAEFPEIDLQPLVFGVFGEAVEPSFVLTPGTRVEICRPLQQDPRDMRWELAQQGSSMGLRSDDGEN